MEYPEFISGIDFRYLSPSQRAPLPYSALRRLVKSHDSQGRAGLLLRLMTRFERSNTSLPDESSRTVAALRDVSLIPRMSTLAIGAMMNRGVADMDPDSIFVNVGLWHGFTFMAGLSHNWDRRAVGIDNFSQFGGPKRFFLKNFAKHGGPLHRFHEMDYREYFRSAHEGPVGFYIYDGHHSYEAQLEGLKVVEPYLVDGAIILVDDTNWDSARLATLDFISAKPDLYEVLFEARTAHNCHPTFWNGVMVIRRKGRAVCAREAKQ